jgi:TRAP-type C4-dicarboxylate transport system permease small subunit
MPALATEAAEPMAGSRTLGRIRKGLDALYLLSGYLSALCMTGILVMTMAQIGARLTGYNLRGAGDYAGYFMAASAFFGFPYALSQGSHIRIELFLALFGRFRVWAEKLSFTLSCLIALWFSYYCWKQVYYSYIFGDRSQGLDATPVWIPQLAMPLGISLMTIAILDHTVRLWATGRHGIPQSEGLE